MTISTLDLTNHFQAIDAPYCGLITIESDVHEGLTTYQLTLLEDDTFWSEAVGYYALEGLRAIYRELVSGKVVINKHFKLEPVSRCRPSVPGRNGPIGAPAFLQGTW